MNSNRFMAVVFVSCSMTVLASVSSMHVNRADHNDMVLTRVSDERPSLWYSWQHGNVMKPLFMSAIELLEQRPAELVINAVSKFVANVVRTTGRPVPEDVVAAFERLRSRVQHLRFRNKLADDPGCDLCKRLITALKTVLLRFSFEELESTIVQVCYLLAEPDMPEDRKQDLCNGSVSIQGPHVAYIIKTSSPDKICEFQNACFLSKAPRKNKSLFRKETVSAKQHQPISDKPIEPITIAQLTDIHTDVRYQQSLDGELENLASLVMRADSFDHIYVAGGFFRIFNVNDTQLGTLTDCQLPICCSDKYGPGNSGPFGDYSCNIPPRTVEQFVKKVADLDPDFILYSGDISGSRVWDESLDEILNCTLALTNALISNIGQHFVYPSFGNHEMFPTNLYYKGSSDVETLTNNLTEWWSPIANFSAEQRQTMNDAGYYSALVRPGLRLVNYNSNYMYTSNFYNVLNHGRRAEVKRMIAFVEREFLNARSNNEKIIFMGHHPTNSGDYLIDFGHWYRELVLNYSDIIVLQIAGHRHCDYFNLIMDDNDQAASLVYLAPPVTAGGRKNPSLRIYSLHPDTFQVLDYDQYYLDLSSVSVNATNIEPQIVHLYSAKQEYNLSDLSAESWASFVDRMEKDDDLLLHHVRYYYVNSRGRVSCDEGCRRAHICGLRNSVYDRHYYCVNSPESSTSVSTPSSIGSSTVDDTDTNRAPSNFLTFSLIIQMVLFSVCFANRQTHTL